MLGNMTDEFNMRCVTFMRMRSEHAVIGLQVK